MENLIYILKEKTENLKIKLYHYLLYNNINTIIDDGFVFGKGDIPILLVAHIDTVFDNPPSTLKYDKKDDILYSIEGGIGGDDRCGIYAILEILETHRPYVLFTEDEEIGCIGAMKAAKKITEHNFKYIIELDRKGNNDCVFYKCGNKDFIKYIESFGFKQNYGAYSDISVLAPTWDIAAVNLSCGYYCPHTNLEYIKFEELQNTIKRAKKILNNYNKAKYFNYQDTEQYYKSLKY